MDIKLRSGEEADTKVEQTTLNRRSLPLILWLYECMIRAALYPRPSLHGSLPPNWACSRRLQCCRRSRTRNPSIATCPNVQGQVPSYCGPNTIQNTVYQMHNRHNKTAKYRIKHKSKAYLKALFTHKILCSSRGSPSKHWTWTKYQQPHDPVSHVSCQHALSVSTDMCVCCCVSWQRWISGYNPNCALNVAIVCSSSWGEVTTVTWPCY